MSKRLPPAQVLQFFLADLDRVLEYSELHENWLAEEHSRYEKHIRADSQKDWDRYDDRNRLPSSMSMQFPQLGRHSLVVYTFALLEDCMEQFCLALRKEYALSAELRDAKGKSIRRAKNYISKAARIEFPTGTKEWRFARDMRVIRDRLIHAGGHQEQSGDARLQRVTARAAGVSASTYSRQEFEIESFYIEDACRHLSRLIKKIATSYEKARADSNG